MHNCFVSPTCFGCNYSPTINEKNLKKYEARNILMNVDNINEYDYNYNINEYNIILMNK
jgi:hypothetical protein